MSFWGVASRNIGIRWRFSFLSFLLPLSVLFSQSPEWIVLDTASSALPRNWVLSILPDSVRGTWIGTFGGGVSLYDGSSWTTYRMSNSSLSSDTVISMVKGPDGSMWCGTHGGGLVHYDYGSWQVYDTANSDIPHNDISGNGFVIGKDGRLWVGTWGGGIGILDGETWSVIDTGNSPLPSNVVWSIAFDDQDRLWVGTLEGAARVDSGTWSVFMPSNSGLPSADIASVLCGKGDTVWLGTWGAGLVRYDGTSWTTYSTLNSGLPNDFVEALTFDKKGALWVGTGGGGAARFDGQSWITINSSNSPMPDNNIRTIAYDHHENMWIATQQGICIYRKGGVITSIPLFEAQNREIPRSLQVGVYPNPSNASFQLTFKLDKSSMVSATVFDMIGRPVRAIVDERLMATGTHTVGVGADLLPSGMYIVRLVAESVMDEQNNVQGMTGNARILIVR